MKLIVTHTLTFATGTQGRAVEQVLLSAINTPQQRVERWSIDMPGMAEAAAFRDAFGNRAHLVSQAKAPPEITVTVTGVVETTDRAGVLGRLEHEPPPGVFRRPTELARSDPETMAAVSATTGRLAQLHELMALLHQGGLSPQSQSQEQSGRGQSQSQSQSTDKTPSATDKAHLFIGTARALGIPARFVTGYLFDDTPASHCWAEAWDDGLGWIGFDPVLDLCPVDRHVRIATGLDARGTQAVRIVPEPIGAPAETLEITEG